MTDPQRKVWYAPNKFESYGQEEIAAVVECLNDGWLAGFGKRSVEFEEKVAAYFGKKHGLFVNSGSSANLLGLACLDLPKGSKIVTPACTFSTTLSPIIQLGLEPVFCDVVLNSYVPSVEMVMEKVTKETKVIMIPNLVGNKIDWKALRERVDKEFPGVILFEDSADTMTFTPYSDVSITSFYASHLITAGGSGGMLMVNSLGHLQRATMIRDWGRIGNNSEEMGDRFGHKVDGILYDFKFLYGALGYNMKSSEMNAAFGLVQLNKIDKFKKIRRDNIERFIFNLQNIPDLLMPNDSTKADWLAFPLQYNNRIQLLTHLENNNIQTRVTFAGNVTRHPAFRQYLQPFPNADTIMGNGFLLGAHHGMTLEDVDYVCRIIKGFLEKPVLPTLPASKATEEDKKADNLDF
eukprot:TRINITY_DN629_c0_g1_i1.p1 TRINITY_DN629_c0_g1~~TRINITY_DN629_c0_g1_i1.p1  ORF type:complete len:407 (+),score=85.42 TRINITY_DN629_c0_g1_i1:126-1346(+)